MKKIGRKKVWRYPLSFRQQMVKLILEQELPIRELSSRYGVAKWTLYRWLDEYSTTRVNSMKKGEDKKGKPISSEDIPTKDMELALLREELRIERLRTAAYKEMIHQAEQYYKIQIEKKSGSKQSNK